MQFDMWLQVKPEIEKNNLKKNYFYRLKKVFHVEGEECIL